MTDAGPSIVVAHDYFTQKGGAERVALEIAVSLGATGIVSPIVNYDLTFPELSRFEVSTSRLSNVSQFRKDPRFAFALLQAAWRELGPVDAEYVICSSSGWSHYLPVAAGTRKIVYCHNPARWLYQPDDYFQRVPENARRALSAALAPMRRRDVAAARSADVYLANSTSVAERVRSAYGIHAEVVHPPVSVDVGGEQSAVLGVEEGFFLVVSRPRSYKGVRTVVDAFEKLGSQHSLVIAGGFTASSLPPNVRSVGRVSDEELRWLYSNARALIGVSREDFGLTPIEANAFGTPVIVLRAGGYLDTTAEGVSGVFVDTLSADQLASQIREFPTRWDPELPRANAERFTRRVFKEQLLNALNGAA